MSVSAPIHGRLHGAIARKSPLTAAGAGGGPQLLSPPEGFDWTPPVSVFYNPATGAYSTDFNADDWKVPASVDIWVSPTGNDTTGDGSEGNPYRGIRKALQEAAARADVPYNIFVQAGEYVYGLGFFGQTCDRDLNIIAVGGRALSTNKFPITSWTLDGAGTYRATRSGIGAVRDSRYPVTWPNGETTPKLLPRVNDLATCQATAGSWYTDNVSVWVHLDDERIPDAGVGGDVGCIIATSGLNLAFARSWYVQGFDIEGTSSIGIRARNSTASVAIPQIVVNDCTVRFHFGALSRAFAFDGVTTCITNNCRAFVSEGDGIGYSQVSAGNPSCNAVEIGFNAYECGAATTHTSIQNGSTNHADGRTVRVNCLYRDSYGPLVGDINTVQSWNIGVDAQGCLLADGTQQDACFSTYAGTGKAWLDGCITGGAFYDLYADAGCQILYTNMAAPASTGGAGTIGTY